MPKVKIFFEMIKFEHTLFALPFAYIGAFLVTKSIPSFYYIFWITMAMVGARTAAMSLNRLIDRSIDSINPRTAGRAIPKGLISVKEVYLYILLSFSLLFIAAYQLNILAVKLLPIAVAILVVYSYLKKYTWLCHLVLGLALGLAPMGSWIAITGKFDLPPIFLAAGVLFWVAGFDIIYACQDYEFDLRYGLYSIPVCFGIKNALYISRLFHFLAVMLFLLVAYILRLGLFFYLGIFFSVFLLIYQHSIVSSQDLKRVGQAFFNANGTLSALMFLFTLLDVLFPWKIF